MSTTETPEALVSACFDETHVSKRIEPFAKKAEEAGYRQLAKMFRAVVTSEEIREGLLRKGIANHAALHGDYFVCPYCGLIFHDGCPEKCPVDETPGIEFIAIE